MEENNKINNEQNDGIRFDVEQTVNVVSADSVENAKKKNNMIPVVVAAAVLFVAVLGGIIWFFAGNNDGKNNELAEAQSSEVHAEHMNNGDQLLEYIENNIAEDLTDEEGHSVTREEYVSKLQSTVNEATTTVSENVGSFNPNTIVVEDETSAESDNTAPEEEIDKAQKAIKMFFDRSCYMKGAMYGGSEGNSLVMSMDGDNFEVLTNLDGTEVSVLSLDGKLYIKRPATKQYLELTETVMDLIGISADDFGMGFGIADYDKMKEKLTDVYTVSYNGAEAVCHEYKGDDQIFKFYTVDGSLKEIDICDSTGESSTQLVIDYFSEAIPGDQLTLKGYTPSSITVIFADLM